MILVCEPNCRRISHETFNLGFLYGLSLTYPTEPIVYLSAESQAEVLKNGEKLLGIHLNTVTFQTIRTYINEDVLNDLWNKYLIHSVFNIARQNGARAIYFLSATRIQQRKIKILAQRACYTRLIVAMNLHGDLDKLAYPHFQKTQINFNRTWKDYIKKLLEKKWKVFPIVFYKAKAVGIGLIKKTYKQLSLEETLLENNGDNIRYVCLSPHIKEGLAKYIDIKKINLKVVQLPAIYRDVPVFIHNVYLKIAVFGYGNSAMLYKLNCALANEDIRKNYEIRIIGMDGRGIEKFPHTTHPINRVLTRVEMQTLAQDIDMFLILYEKERYVLSCSGSIIEAHSYAKPILHLTNPCINAFNRKERPIGICCENIEDMSSKMASIINNYDAFLPELEIFRENIIQQRKEIDIRNNLKSLKDVLGDVNGIMEL